LSKGFAARFIPKTPHTQPFGLVNPECLYLIVLSGQWGNRQYTFKTQLGKGKGSFKGLCIRPAALKSTSSFVAG